MLINVTFILDEQRTIARAVNSTIRNAQATIEPLLTNDGILPVDFPHNYSELECASVEAIKTLLFMYGQPVEGDQNTCKRRLLGFLGIVALCV